MSNTLNKKLPKGITLHRGKLRIAFRPAGLDSQIKRSLQLLPTARNIKVAELKLNAIRNDIMIGRFNIDDHFANDPLSKTTPLYIEELLGKYFMDAVSGWKPSTTQNTQTQVDTLVRELKGINMRKYTLALATELQAKLSKGRKSVTVKIYLNILKRAFRNAASLGAVDSSPIEALLHLKDGAKKIDTDNLVFDDNNVYTIEEAERIVNELYSPFQQRFFQFSFWTGIRPGELAALRREDICLPFVIIRRNLTQKGVEVTPKTGKMRKILLPSLAQSVLISQLESHKNVRVWTNSYGEPFTCSRVIRSSTWLDATKRAKVKRLVPYTTRHSFASWMLKAGESEATVAAHLGHASIEMVRTRYGHFIPEKEPKWTLDDPNKIVELKNLMKSG